jgi:hypothetical protein
MQLLNFKSDADPDPPFDFDADLDLVFTLGGDAIPDLGPAFNSDSVPNLASQIRNTG